MSAKLRRWRLNPLPRPVPVMAHPPANTSNLSLERFIVKVAEVRRGQKEHSKIDVWCKRKQENKRLFGSLSFSTSWDTRWRRGLSSTSKNPEFLWSLFTQSTIWGGGWVYECECTLLRLKQNWISFPWAAFQHPIVAKRRHLARTSQD